MSDVLNQPQHCFLGVAGKKKHCVMSSSRYGDRHVIPSYLMTGKRYLIEKSKEKMIAEDIKHAIELAN